MSLIESWASFFSRYARGSLERTGFPFTEAYLKAWCKVVQKYPNLVGIPSYGRAFANAACERIGYPSPTPQREYEGGNCNILYKVTGTYVEANSNNGCGLVQPWYLSRSIRGPLLPFSTNSSIANQVRSSSDAPLPVISDVPISVNPNGQLTVSVAPSLCFTGQPNEAPLCYPGNFKITKAIPQEPIPVGCPPQPIYPNDPVINNKDFNLNITIPIVNDTGAARPSLNIPVKITVNPSLTLKVELNIDGDRYEFDYNGFNKIDVAPTINIPRLPKTNDPKVRPSPPVSTTPTEDVEETVTSGEDLVWVLVDVVQEPVKGKTITYKNTNDITYFAGYLHWLVGGQTSYKMPEIPIRKKKNGFQPPEGVDGYRLIACNGAILSARKYTQTSTT